MYQKKASLTYQQINLESQINNATLYQLTSILLNEAISAIKRAEIFIQQNNIYKKSEAITKAIKIIDIGLKEMLYHDDEKKRTNNLENLYNHMVFRLINANSKNNLIYIQEVHSLLLNISSAWQKIGKSLDGK